MKLAERYAAEPIPALDVDALFAEYAKTGRRGIYEKPFRLRTSRSGGVHGSRVHPTTTANTCR